MRGIQSTTHSRPVDLATPLHAVLDERAEKNPGGLALRFLVDGEAREVTTSFSELAEHARRCAQGLMDRDLAGKPVLIALPPGIDFVTALFGCWHAGSIAVPAYPPKGSRHKARFQAVLADSRATHALVSPDCQDLSEVYTVNFADLLKKPPIAHSAIVRKAPCLLQYTSGSTATPKGVMISHLNLRAHFHSLSSFRNLGLRSVLSWLPPYHDMGLVLKILYSIEAGIPLTFFSPDHFIQRPYRWLRAISHYRAELSGAPNFAFEACIRSVRDEELESLDLSSWKLASCGAERIRPDTLKRFAAKFAPCGFKETSFCPGYGLAETTLIVTARKSPEQPLVSHHPTAGSVVSCGSPLAGNKVRITNPETGEELPDWSLGEIRVSGPAVSDGYWKRPEETAEAFCNGELATGDLGFLANGELHVTGRINDLIIVDGVNIAPEDVEGVLLECSQEILAAAAFPVDEDQRETVGLALEISSPRSISHSSLIAQVRDALMERMGISPALIHLVRPGLLPRTTSGKIQRHACRAYLANRSVPSWRNDVPGDVSLSCATDTMHSLLESARQITGHDHLTAHDDIVALGVGSLDATRLAARIRGQFGVRIPVATLFDAGTFRRISAMIDASGRLGQEWPEPAPTHAPRLTHAQERMWFLHQFAPQSAAYHVFGAVELLGSLDAHRLRQAYQEVIANHDILRTRHGSHDGRPSVWLAPDHPVEIEEIDADVDAAVIPLLQEFARRPFDLTNDIPIRALLARLSANRHVLAISAHHIVADGWSMRILAGELAERYSGHAEIRKAPSYLSFAESHRAWIESGAVTRQIDYWKRMLEGHSGISTLPTDHPRSSTASSEGGFLSLKVPDALVESVAEIAKRHRTTPFTVHLALFLLLLRQHGSGQDHVIAIPAANRNHDGNSDLVGTLVNTLPFRMRIDPDERFVDLLARVRTTSFEMIEHQDAPFEMIIDAIKPERANNHSPIAQIMFDHQEIPLEQTWAGGIVCKPFHVHRGSSQFDLSLLLTSYGSQQQLGIEFRTDLFRETTVEAMLVRFLDLMKRACGDPDQSVSAISSLPGADADRLAAISNGPARPSFLGQTPLGLIAKRIASHPHRPAVLASGETLTYGDLDELSSRIAMSLRGLGISRGDRVAILLERSHWLPVAILSLWKLGAAYVPLDQSNPRERLRLILSDQAPLHVLANGSLSDLVPEGFPVIRIENCCECLERNVEFEGVSPDDPAYLIYTSGSTGRPKGVLVSHQALANFLLSMAEAPGFTEADRLLAVTTISFDISCLELFLPLIVGGSVEIASSEAARDGLSLIRLLAEGEASVMQATPATWRLLLEAGWQGSPALKILCGGEALDLPLARSLARMGCQLWNLYGPTESTVWSSCWKVPDSPEQIRIGSPIANTGLHLLSEDGGVLPPGSIGHLWISGDGLAQGYWRNPDLTAERFRTIRLADGSMITAYQTGDLARWHADGSLECLGRTDSQVKIRGFRIELGEIEATMNEHPGVAFAKVALRGETHHDARLVAWVKASAEGEPDANSIREFLADRLPVYMIPADIGFVDEFPLTSSGKVDPQQLADPRMFSTDRKESQSPIERAMTELWSRLLERHSVALDDNWFQIGGHSLLALRLFAGIHQTFGCKLPLSAILEHPSPRQLAALVERQSRPCAR